MLNHLLELLPDSLIEFLSVLYRRFDYRLLQVFEALVPLV